MWRLYSTSIVGCLADWKQPRLREYIKKTMLEANQKGMYFQQAIVTGRSKIVIVGKNPGVSVLINSSYQEHHQLYLSVRNCVLWRTHMYSIS